jgi:hypothetical protein
MEIPHGIRLMSGAWILPGDVIYHPLFKTHLIVAVNTAYSPAYYYSVHAWDISLEKMFVYEIHIISYKSDWTVKLRP